MPYNGDPTSSPVNAIRFWLQDTSASAPLLSDQEIQYFIGAAADYSDDPILIAAELCPAIIAKYAGEKRITGDGITYDSDGLQAKYQALASELRATWSRMNGNKAAPYAGGVEYNDSTRAGARPHAFHVGQNDDPSNSSSLGGQSLGDYNDGVLDVPYFENFDA